MSNGLLYSANYNSFTNVLSLVDRTGNVLCSFDAPLRDDVNKPLMLKSKQDGSTVKLKCVGTFTGTFEVSTDGTNWSPYTVDTTGTDITLNKGEAVLFRRTDSDGTVGDFTNYLRLVLTGRIEAWNNVNSLMRSGDTSPHFYGLFAQQSSLVKAPLLPAIQVGTYGAMFYNCTALEKAPELPATTLSEYCYYMMFGGCTSLVEAPEIKATTLAPSCFAGMFYGCTSLTKAADIIATKTRPSCCSEMYSGCTSLVNPPIINLYTVDWTAPAPTVGSEFYRMFYGCTSLVRSPILLFTGGGSQRFQEMFSGCTALSEITSYLRENMSASNCLTDWVSGVSATGTFYADPYVTWATGTSGIPTGWTIQDIYEGVFTDDATKPLTFKPASNRGTIGVRLNAVGSPNATFETSQDGGATWQSYTLGTYIYNTDDNGIMFRRTSGGNYDANNYVKFSQYDSSTYDRIAAMNNVNSMISDSFDNITTAPAYAFYKLFDGFVGLTRAPLMPCTTVSAYCYAYAFNGCTYLTESPVLPATKLAEYYASDPTYCYRSLFEGCTRLKKITCMAQDNIYSTKNGTQSGSIIYANTDDWVKNVAASGTFYYPKKTTAYGDQYDISPYWSMSSSYWKQPSGWTEVDITPAT